MIGGQNARGLEQRTQQVANFAAAAAGQDSEKTSARRETVARKRLGAALRGGDAVEQRMADEADAPAGARVEFSLEREDHGYPVGAPDEFADSSTPPCPDLWQDVIKHRDASAPRRSGKHQVELGIVNEDEKVGRIAAQNRTHRAECAEGAADRGGEFGDAESGDIFGVD